MTQDTTSSAEPAIQDDWLTVEQAAELLCDSPRSIRRHAARGVIEARKFGRDWQIRARAVQEQAANHTTRRTA